jgi:hypothetical protein
MTTDKSRSILNKTNQDEELKKNYSSQNLLHKFLNKNRFLIKSSKSKIETPIIKDRNFSNSELIKNKTSSQKK